MRRTLNVRLILSLALLLHNACSGTSGEVAPREDRTEFSFAFIPDIHLREQHRYPGVPQDPELSPLRAFAMVIDTVNRMGVDFVITGGDLVYDVLRGQPEGDSLFRMYRRAIEGFDAPVYNVIGNHELFGIYDEGGRAIDPLDPDYKYGMYERHLGNTYYSFDHKGWHFVVLNSIDERDRRYVGIVDAEQIAWLRDDLASVDPATPIAVAVHIPFVSVQRQVYPGPAVPQTLNELWILNGPEVLSLFERHNLRLVLQGHLHWIEDVYVSDTDTRFITGGAVAGRPSWRGFRHGPPGFLLIEIRDQSISWEFIDYGWQALIERWNAIESARF